MKLIYPWMAGKMDASKTVKAEVMQELKARYPGVVGMTAPSTEVIQAVTIVCTKLIELADSGSVPWVVAASSSVPLLQTLARLVPATMALTRLAKPMNVTTDMMVDTFRQPSPLDDFAPDPAGDLLHSFKNRGIVVWENFSELRHSGYKYAAQFMTILGGRLEGRRMTVFLCPAARGLQPKELVALFDRIEKTIGPNGPNLLRESASWHFLKATQAETFKVREEKL